MVRVLMGATALCILVSSAALAAPDDGNTVPPRQGSSSDGNAIGGGNTGNTGNSGNTDGGGTPDSQGSSDPGSNSLSHAGGGTSGSGSTPPPPPAPTDSNSNSIGSHTNAHPQQSTPPASGTSAQDPGTI